MGLKSDIIVTLTVIGILGLIIGVIFLSIIALKAVGLLLVLFGIFMLFYFPGSEEYQDSYTLSFLETGIIIGIIAFIIGFYLIFA